MKETSFSNNLRKFLEENNGGSIKLGASVFLAKGTPDMICFYKKHTFFVESKVHPNKPTPIQLATIDKIRKEGGYAWVATLMKDGTINEGVTIEQFFESCVQKIRSDRGPDPQ